MSELLEAARHYLRRGWMPVYVPPGVKGPNRHGWEKLRLAEVDLPAHFSRPGNIGIVLGEASGGLVDVDLDCPEALGLADQFLPATPAVTGRPGARRSHRWYVSDVHSTRQFRDPKTRKMIVELRSTGGQTLVGPSLHAETNEPYDFLDGEPAHVPADVLAAAVQAIHEAVVRMRYGEVPQKRAASAPSAGPRKTEPDADERRALAYLNAMPPAISGSGGHDATYAAATALVHGFGLSAGRALQLLLAHYNPRCQPPWTEKELQHKVQDATSKPHDRPLGWLRSQNQIAVPDDDVDVSGIMAKASQKEEKKTADRAYADPGEIPDSMLRVPGFVSEVMDYTLATAPYPQLELAFTGALSLQAVLAGRKVKDALDNRTTLYVVALANSGAGKEHPRKINQRILMAAGMPDSFGDSFASGEGTEDRLHITNTVLFQTDEINDLMTAMRDVRETRYQTVLSVLLKFYSSCNGVYSLRVKAGKEHRYIDQPNLCIFGTAIPPLYYESLSPRMLTNGFFARVIVIEAGKRGAGQESAALDLPDRVVAAAKWWGQFKPGNSQGNLGAWHPDPKTVALTPDATRALRADREEADREYALAEAANDIAAMAIWARAYEKARRLALIYACSENHLEPLISRQAAEWAWGFARHQTQRMLFKAQNHVAENPFHALCLKAMEKLRAESDRTLQHSKLLKRMKIDAQTFQKIVETLCQQNDIDVVLNPTPGRTGKCYRLAEGGERSG